MLYPEPRPALVREKVGIKPLKLVQLPETRDATGKYLWYWVAGAWFLTFAILSFISPGYGKDSAHYLLSSLPQCLSAVLALTLTLPLAFAGLSGYVLDEAHRMVRNWVFISYAALYAASALFCLALFRWTQPVTWGLDLAISLAVACLSSLWLYARWVAERLQPSMYIDRLMVRIYRLATLPVGAKEPVRRWLWRILCTPLGLSGVIRELRWKRSVTLSGEGASALFESTSLAVHVARLSMRNGATRYVDLVVDRLMRFWILGSLDKDYALVGQAEDALELIITPALAIDAAAFNFVTGALKNFFIVEYVRKTDLTSIQVDRIRALERMLGTALAPRLVDEPQWRTASTVLWTIGTILTAAAERESDHGYELTAAKELATFARYRLADALQLKVAQLKIDYPGMTSKGLKTQGIERAEFAFHELTEAAFESAAQWDAGNRDMYSGKATQFAKLVDRDEVLRVSGISAIPS
jgi:hypothetical protein